MNDLRRKKSFLSHVQVQNKYKKYKSTKSKNYDTSASVSCSAAFGASASSVAAGGDGDRERGRIMKGEVRAPWSNCSIWSNRALTSVHGSERTFSF